MQDLLSILHDKTIQYIHATQSEFTKKKPILLITFNKQSKSGGTGPGFSLAGSNSV